MEDNDETKKFNFLYEEEQFGEINDKIPEEKNYGILKIENYDFLYNFKKSPSK